MLLFFYGILILIIIIYYIFRVVLNVTVIIIVVIKVQCELIEREKPFCTQWLSISISVNLNVYDKRLLVMMFDLQAAYFPKD